MLISWDVPFLDVSYVMTGLIKALKEEITKTSPTLGRDAVYVKEAALTRLPAYLTINFVRFYFKRSTQENCKIRKVGSHGPYGALPSLATVDADLTTLPTALTPSLNSFGPQDVKFPMRLDVLDLCDEELKEKLRPMREKFAAYQDWEAEQQASVCLFL
jgi:ubiquitin carboxyl-terminal hydrolase 14